MCVLEGIAITTPAVAFLPFRFFNTRESAILALRTFAFRAFDIFISFSPVSSCVLGFE